MKKQDNLGDSAAENVDEKEEGGGRRQIAAAVRQRQLAPRSPSPSVVQIFLVLFKSRTVTRQRERGPERAEKAAEKMLFLQIIKMVFDGVLKAKDTIKHSAGKVKRNQMHGCLAEQ